MKKILLSLVMMFVMAQSCFAASNCVYNCVASYDLSPGILRFFSVISGTNFVGRHVAASMLKKEIEKTLEGNFSVSVNSYSITDLRKGIFKKISLKGKNVNLQGVHFTQLKLRTICGFNYISLKDVKNPVFKENLPIAFYVVMTEDDINQTMAASGYEKVINDLNSFGDLLGGVFKVAGSQVKIQNDKLFYILKVNIPFVRTPQSIVLASDLKVAKGDIDFSNTKIVNSGLSLNLGRIDKIINYINPLDFSLEILENKDAKLTVQNVKIEDDKIYIEGVILVPKD